MAEANKNVKGTIAGLSVHHTDAYAIAVRNGYEGTEAEWLASLVGKSAYEIAVMNGYKGTEAEWNAEANKHKAEAKAAAESAKSSENAAKSSAQSAKASEEAVRQITEGLPHDIGSSLDDIKYLNYYNYRIKEMTSDYVQNYFGGAQEGTRKVCFLAREGIDYGDFAYVTAMMNGATHIVYHPFRTGSLSSVDLAATKWVLVPRGITSISISDLGNGFLDLSAFGQDAPFPVLDTPVGSVMEVVVPSGREGELFNMTNWCDATIMTVDTF